MAANVTAFTNWSATASSNQPDGSDAADIDADLRQIQAEVRKYTRTKGSDIASASTVDLSNATGDYIDITGTTTITSFGTVSAGMRFILQFDDALTLAHNGTSLILPGEANITTATGDVAIMESLGSGNWKCIAYTRASGAALDAELAAIAGLTSAANKVPMFSGSGTATLIDFKDEDNMASDSATAVPSQQSTKAYADTKNIATQVPPGAAGNVLVSNGSGWESASAPVFYGSAQAASSGTSVSFNSIPSGVKRITVALNRVSLSGTEVLRIRIGTGGTPEISGYESGASDASNNTITDNGFLLARASGSAASDRYSGVVTFMKIDASTNTWVASGAVVRYSTGDTAAVAGSITLAGELDVLQIMPTGSDTFDGSGYVNIAWG